jgi:prolyl-tRNA synthetase
MVMRYSKLFGRTRREVPKDEVSLNAKLLIQAGFINKELAGVYTFLPLGLRVLNKINNILREEMDRIGGQEVQMTVLQNKELWEKTDRWDDEKIDAWFKTKLKNDTEMGLGLTHEEPLTQMAKNWISSYRDLPFYIYQIQTKFRNETRSKSGIIRGREFPMKDLYSFNRNNEDLDAFYEKCIKAYKRFFERIGLGDSTYLTFASGGMFSKYSHEFQTICDAGEDKIYLDHKKKIAVNDEVYNDEVLTDLGLKKQELVEEKAVETGNIFKLGTRFSKALDLSFIDENGERKPVVMGSYGIGPGRSMGTVVELFNDDRGIIWPEAIAPYKVSLIGLGQTGTKKALDFYKKLVDLGVEVLFDDREESAGVKFADADLIGCPYRVVISDKSLEAGGIELKKRSEKEMKIVSEDEMLKILNA